MDTPLKRLRTQRGLTLMEVAAGTGIDTGNLSRIERGRQTSKEAAEKLVHFYGADAISEIHILYPERFQDRSPSPAAPNAPEPAAA